jgi:serine/threonine protein kinase
MPDAGTPGPKVPDTSPARETIAPGALSALLAELVCAPETPLPEPTTGTVIGRFELLRRLGAGGFGVVWEARDRQLGRTVAVKLIRPGERAELREESLLREAEAAARLSHDNIVALHDVGKSEFGPYLVLELLRGQTLADRLATRPLPLIEAVRIVRDMTRGVAQAHAEGVVHRDLKPANVFVCDDGRVKVLDFGLAHAFGRRRQSGGTPAYMAPEQWKDAPEDERTDVFALGVILHQALSGALPFAGEKEAVGSGRAPRLEIDAAPELGPLVARMLEKDPLQRPRDAGEVLAALDAALETLERSGATATAPVRTRRHPRRRLAGLIAAGVALGVAVALGVTHLRGRPSTLGGRLVVAVADVVNETGEKELDVLSGLLITSLEQSRKLAVMTQARVLDLAAQAGRTGLSRVDEALGREVGQRNGVTTLLLPAIRRLGSVYTVEMRAIDPVRDQHLFTLSDRSSSKEGLLDLLDRLSEKTRRELHEDPAELEKSRIQLGSAMTRSLEAYQHYAAGIELRHRDGLWAAALAEQQKAIELDPQFAAAHLQVARLYEVYGREDLAAPHYQVAYANLDRMPEMERTIIRIFQLGKGPERERLVEELAARFPNDKYATWFMAAQSIQAENNPDRALAGFRRVLELDPGYSYAVGDAMTHPGTTEEEALRIARRSVAVRRSAFNLALLSMALSSRDRVESTALALESLRLSDGQTVNGTLNACGALTRQGAGASCLPFLEKMVTAGPNQFERDMALDGLVGQYMVLGRVREGLRVASALRPLEQYGPSLVGRFPSDAPEYLAWVRKRNLGKKDLRNSLAWFGDLKGAAAVDATIPAAERGRGQQERMYQALVAAGQGRHDEAIRFYRTVPEEDLKGGVLLYWSHYRLAETLLAAGRAAEAAAVKAPWPTRLNFDANELAENYPRLLVIRARANEQLGRKADAVKELDAVLAFWKEADADLPLLVEAKAMRARLVASAK